MRELWRRLQFYLRRDRFEQELDEEMRHHLAMKAAENGGSRQAAALKFGNTTLLKEDSRSMWTWKLVEELGQDLRYSWRIMRANPLFTAMAVVTLALGIGANAAIYSFLEAILLRPLPVVSHAEQLVALKWRGEGRVPVVRSLTGSMYREGKTGRVSPNFPYAFYESLRNDPGPLSKVFTWAWAGTLTVVARGQAESLPGEYVGGNHYSVLGVAPATGRLITDDDDRSGAPLVTVLGYRYWERRFGLDAMVVGQQIVINNVPFTVIGVTPQGFRGISPDTEPAVSLPVHALPQLSQRPDKEAQRRFLNKNFYWAEIIGRLRPGVSAQQAQGQLAGRLHQFAESTVSKPEDRANLPVLRVDDAHAGRDSLRREFSDAILVLMTMVGLILAMACANIANLLLARAASRRREIAVRLSLGAGRWRIVRQLLTESLLLSSMGAAIGLGIALWGIRAITWLLSEGPDFTLHAAIDLHVLGFTIGLALLTGVLFGLAPALQATGGDLTPALKASRGMAPGRRPGRIFGLGQTLIVAQVAISLVLTIGAGLFVHTIANLNAVHLGFQSENVLTFAVNAKLAGYKGADLARFYADLTEKLRRVPGVRSVSFSDMPLASQMWRSLGIAIPGVAATPGKSLEVATLHVNPTFFATMGIPVVGGRGLEERDMSSPKVVVVNEEFAKEFLGGQNPVGRFIGIGEGKTLPADIEVIGVAKNAVYNSIREEKPPAMAYLPYTWDLSSLGESRYELRTGSNPMALAGAVRQVVHQASPLVPVASITTQQQRIDETINRERTLGNLGACFGILAIVIACVGLYGTVAYAVARRTSEIGIRVALGARQGSIVWMVMRQVAVLAAIGMAIGFVAARQTTKFVESFLFGLKGNDPWTMAAAVLVLASAAGAAGFGPARRASKIDPARALRQE